MYQRYKHFEAMLKGPPLPESTSFDPFHPSPATPAQLQNTEHKRMAKVAIHHALLIGQFHFAKEHGKPLIVELELEHAQRFEQSNAGTIMPDDTPVTHDVLTGKAVEAPSPAAEETKPESAADSNVEADTNAAQNATPATNKRAKKDKTADTANTEPAK